MTWPYNYFKNRGIPGPKPVPFLGNMNEFGKEVSCKNMYSKIPSTDVYFKFIHKRLRTYTIQVCRRNIVSVIILNNNFHKFMSQWLFYTYLPPQ